ncbi:hypothetical protein ZIOFF_030837 [Zingiber officinale]|uniref:Uncharacterized protein n=1 Tax=Zingiber officinale TaxID=94328 RepID=A0A8J5GW47_ZINOF|nr:hypothetical protein ZIOFF_030837 [Zingiber officinale]
MALDQPGGGGGGGGDWWWWTEHANVYLLRPLLAVFFVLCLIVLSWFIAWKTVLVHVPLVQEIFGLRKKPVKPKPRNSHRLSRFYNSIPDLRPFCGQHMLDQLSFARFCTQSCNIDSQSLSERCRGPSLFLPDA